MIKIVLIFLGVNIGHCCLGTIRRYLYQIDSRLLKLYCMYNNIM